MLSIKKQHNTRWKNWSESVVAQPKKYAEPSNLNELIDLVQECSRENLTIRVVGAGHSFTPLVATSDVLVSLDQLSGIDQVDNENDLVTVWAGSRLKDLGPLLFAYGYAMENLGDINEQSIAGAISTGTHGTGIEFGSISTQVTSVTILTSSGELMEISKSMNRSYLEPAKLSLGMLGIIVKVQLKVVPTYQLVSKSYRLSLQNCLTQLETLCNENRNFEFFWFPYTKTVQVKTFNKTEQPVMNKSKQHTFKKVVVENGLFWALSEVSRMVPRSSKIVSTISAMGVPVGEEMNSSHLLYATPRLVKFQEMEYSVPADAMSSVIRDIESMLDKKRYSVHFPIECRYVKSDSIWLSPSYQRDSAYIAVHMYKGMEFEEYFKAIEEIFQAYDGRPHWGKMHTMTYEQLQKVYPKLEDFLQVRQQVDQQGLFLNEYIRNVFNV